MRLVTLYVICFMVGVVGWLLNLIDVVAGFVHSGPVTTLFIGRLIGIVIPPLGAMLGFF